MAYEFIEHPADVGVRVSGETLETLFAEAAMALADIAGVCGARSMVRLNVDVEGLDLVDLLVRWLQELLYLIQVGNVRMACVDIMELKETRLKASVKGERSSDPPAVEIKAVTYHGLEIRRVDNAFEAVIILDI